MKPQTLQQAYQKGWNDCLKMVVEDLEEMKMEELNESGDKNERY